jgi:radical SAM superfamily enzyme YgiQ (UPF0313 family)
MSEENVLLIYPPFEWGTKDLFCQPLGVLTLGAALKEAGINVQVVDLAGEGWQPKKLARFIAEGDFTHVGTTVITPFRDIAYSILDIAKTINPDITTLVGGPHVSYNKEIVFSESPNIDIAVSGEAELGLAEIIRNPKEKFYDLGYVKDIDQVAFPDRSYVRHIKYNQISGIWMDDTASMNWARGCPWRKCRFCSRNELTMHYRARTPEKIIEEIAIIQNEQKYRNLMVVDDSLRINSKFVKKVLRLKIKEGLDIPFWTLARADHIDEEGMQLMRRANAAGLQIGVESVVPRIIDSYRKFSGKGEEWVNKLETSFNLAHKYDIITIGSFIIGGPTETKDEIQQTIDYLRKSKVDIAQAFAFQYVVGSEFWKEAREKGLIKSDQIYPYNDKKYGTTEFTTEELLKMMEDSEHLINSPIKHPRRYIRLVKKFIKQKKWRVIFANIFRLPLIIKRLLFEHPYDVKIDEHDG